MEFIVGICFVLAFLSSHNILEFVLLAALFASLILLSLIDMRLKAVPEWLLWLNFTIAFIFCALNDGVFTQSAAEILITFAPEILSLFAVKIPAYVVFLANAALFAGFIFLLKSLVSFVLNLRTNLAKVESMGEADILLIATMGGFLGLKFGFYAIFLAALLALPCFLIAKKRDFKMPFVPFLSLSFIVFFAVKFVPN